MSLMGLWTVLQAKITRRLSARIGQFLSPKHEKSKKEAELAPVDVSLGDETRAA